MTRARRDVLWELLMRVGAGCEDVLLMRLSGLVSQRIEEDVRETVAAGPGGIATATPGWRGFGSCCRPGTRSWGSTWPAVSRLRC
jgi:hypothetical protein